MSLKKSVGYTVDTVLLLKLHLLHNSNISMMYSMGFIIPFIFCVFKQHPPLFLNKDFDVDYESR